MSIIKRLFIALIDNALKFNGSNENPHINIDAADEQDFWHFTS